MTYLGVVVKARLLLIVIVLFAEDTTLQDPDSVGVATFVSKTSLKSGGISMEAPGLFLLDTESISDSLTDEVLSESSCGEGSTLVDSFDRIG